MVQSRLIAIVSLALPLGLTGIGGCTTVGDFPVENKSAALYLATGCDDQLEQSRADANAKIDLEIAREKQYFEDSLFAGLVVDIPLGSYDEATDGGDDSGFVVGDSRGVNADDSPDEFSETNTQVDDVDEADIVKTDGERIYLLHGNSFYLFDSWPANATAILGSAEVPGAPYEMFVDGGKATVFSGVAPTDLPAAPTRGLPTRLKNWDCYDCEAASFTQMSVYDVTGDAPVLEREILVEGAYVSGRRHGNAVRAVLSGGYAMDGLYSGVSSLTTAGRHKSRDEFQQDLEQWGEDVKAYIAQSNVTDWLPRRFERIDGELVELPNDCSSYYDPQPGSAQDGMTQVVTFDLESPAAPSVVSVLGYTTTVYASEDVLVLAQADYRWSFQQTARSRTAFHIFDLDGASTQYEASGFVPGELHNQFSIDERDGVIRVSTSEEVVTDPDSWTTRTENRVFTLGADGRQLRILGKTEPFGEEGETIFATRFLGDRGYVVTFRQTDPLITVDLGDPRAPKVLGALHIPGFSDYIHPLPDHRILTIGQDADENGTQTGVKLAIFDVSANTAVETQSLFFAGSNYSEVSSNHKAFTFMQDKFAQDLSLLMFPITSYDPQYSSRLEVLSVSAADGFTSLGSIDHTDLLDANCTSQDASGADYCYYSGQDMRRGVEVGGNDGDFIYAISYGGMTVHNLSNPSETLQSIPLATPQLGY